MQYIETGIDFYSSGLMDRIEDLPEWATVARLWIWLLCAAKGRQRLMFFLDFRMLAEAAGAQPSEVEKAIEHMERLGIVRTSNHREYKKADLPDAWEVDNEE